MAAPLDTEIERDLVGENMDDAGNRQSQISTISSRARAFVKTLSGKETETSSQTHPFSISLDLMHNTDGNDPLASSKYRTSPVSENSMRLNYSSASMDKRLTLDLTPLHEGRHRGVDSETPPISTPEARNLFEYVAYEDVDSGQKEEFEKLLKKESSCTRSWVHKGLIVNLFFLVVLVVGVVLGEVYFPLEGVRGRELPLRNDTDCLNNTAGCFTVRLVRAVGIFGLLGGVTNWIAIEMLFRSIPFLFGTGVFAKKHKDIRERIKRIVVDILFDPAALRHYFTGRQRNLREIFQLENHFGGLLESEATRKIVDKKIDAILARPEGFVLSMMGVDHSLLKATIKDHILAFIMEISPNILDAISSPGLTDGVGLQAEVERILEERTEELTALKVRQLMSAMIRKHLNWLIVWGNVLGALAGLLAEVVAIVVAKYADRQ